MQMQAACRDVHVAADVEDYIIRLVHATRKHPSLQLGASPRAMLALYHTSQVMAALRGRSFVIPDDVKYLTVCTLSHRIIPKAESSLRGNSAEQALREIIDSVSVPVENENMAR
jgi:MoxR-like ATPase